MCILKEIVLFKKHWDKRTPLNFRGRKQCKSVQRIRSSSSEGETWKADLCRERYPVLPVVREMPIVTAFFFFSLWTRLIISDVARVLEKWALIYLESKLAKTSWHAIWQYLWEIKMWVIPFYQVSGKTTQFSWFCAVCKHSFIVSYCDVVIELQITRQSSVKRPLVRSP